MIFQDIVLKEYKTSWKNYIAPDPQVLFTITVQWYFCLFTQKILYIVF
jgi:hypothetical protein